MRSPDQQHQPHLSEMQNLRPIPYLLTQSPHFHKMSRAFLCTFELEKHLFSLGSMVAENQLGKLNFFFFKFIGPESFYLGEEALTSVLFEAPQ